MLIRADHEHFTSKQFAHHEIGHDKIAKGQVDIKAVRKRLEEKVGKEAIDSVAQTYAEAYGRTGLDADEVWEEIVCDIEGGMNWFADERGELMQLAIQDVKGVVESETVKTTEGVTEGKASREKIPKRDKALYASGVSFLHKNFPPENERLSEAHRLATWWARSQSTETGDQTLIFMNDVCYLVECFDDALNYYQVEDVISKAEFDSIYKEIKENGRSGQIKSVQGSSDFIDKLNQSISASQKGKPSSNSNTARYRTEDNQVQRVGESTLTGRERSSSDRGGDSQSRSENKQKYSRELDTEYLSAVERGDMDTAQRMVDEAAKKAGYSDDSSWRMQHTAPNSNSDVSLYDLKESGLVPNDYWDHPEWYTYSAEERESFYKVKAALSQQERWNSEGKKSYNGKPLEAKIWVYRAVDKTVNSREEHFRNGDWVTPSYDYAVNEGQMNPNGYRIIKCKVSIKNLYWDGNSIAELGYDDGNTYAYRDTVNNRKLLDPVTYDDYGNIIPLSKRFKFRNSDTRYSRELDLIDYVNEKAGGEEYKPLTNRELLASALESVTVDADERKILESYNAEVKDLNRAQARLDKVGAELKELIFEKGARDKAAIERLTKEKNDLLKKINKSDKRLLKIEAMEPVKAVMEQEKKKAYKKAAEKGREALHRNVEGRHKTEIRHKIKGLKGKFISMLEHPTERQYVPADLVSAMVEVCELVDTDAPLYKPDGSVNKAQQARNEQMQRLLKLSDEYKALKNNPDPMYSGEYDEEIQEYLDDLRREFLGKPISDMTLGELNELYTTMRAIEETLRDARKLIGWGEADLVYDAGDRIIAEQKDITVKRKGKGENSTKDLTSTEKIKRTDTNVSVLILLGFFLHFISQSVIFRSLFLDILIVKS